MENEVKLTKLASCAGCGAKVGAGTLCNLLEGFQSHYDPNLLVGYDMKQVQLSPAATPFTARSRFTAWR